MHAKQAVPKATTQQERLYRPPSHFAIDVAKLQERLRTGQALLAL